MKWGRCAVDFGWHAIDEGRDHPVGMFEAQCGHRLPIVDLWDEPYGVGCRACAALPFELATDFVESARLLGDGLVSAAMVTLVPLHLTEQGDR